MNTLYVIMVVIGIIVGVVSTYFITRSLKASKNFEVSDVFCGLIIGMIAGAVWPFTLVLCILYFISWWICKLLNRKR